MKSFEEHINAAQLSNLPLIVHTRSAEAETLDLLGKGALPLGLLAVGAGLSFGVLARSPFLLLISNFKKVHSHWQLLLFNVIQVLYYKMSYLSTFFSSMISNTYFNSLIIRQYH